MEFTKELKELPDFSNDIPLGFVVDDEGKLISFRDASGYMRVYTYDDEGRIASTRTEDGYRSKFTRGENEKGEPITSWQNSLGMSVIY